MSINTWKFLNGLSELSPDTSNTPTHAPREAAGPGPPRAGSTPPLTPPPQGPCPVTDLRSHFTQLFNETLALFPKPHKHAHSYTPVLTSPPWWAICQKQARQNPHAWVWIDVCTDSLLS